MRTVLEETTKNENNSSQKVVPLSKIPKTQMNNTNSATKDHKVTQKENHYKKNIINVLQRSRNIHKNVQLSNLVKKRYPLKAMLKQYNPYGFGAGRNKYKRKTGK